MRFTGYNIVSLACVVIAGGLVFSGKDGWGWFLFVALLVWTAPEVEKRKKQKNNNKIIKRLEIALKHYEKELESNVTSQFHQGCVKNLKEWIAELKGEESK